MLNGAGVPLISIKNGCVPMHTTLHKSISTNFSVRIRKYMHSSSPKTTAIFLLENKSETSRNETIYEFVSHTQHHQVITPIGALCTLTFTSVCMFGIKLCVCSTIECNLLYGNEMEWYLQCAFVRSEYSIYWRESIYAF